MKVKTYELIFDGNYNTIEDLPESYYGISIYNQNSNTIYIKLSSNSPEMPVEAGDVYYQENINFDQEKYTNEGVQIKGTNEEAVVLEVLLTNAQTEGL